MQAPQIEVVVFARMFGIEAPIREFLRSPSKVLAYATRMLEGFFPELPTASRSEARSMPALVVV
jgi:hypothetical protein